LDFRRTEDEVGEFAQGSQIFRGDRSHPFLDLALQIPDRAKFRKLLNRKIVEPDRKCAIFHQEFRDYSDNVQAPKIPKQWEAPGEMIIRTTSRQRIAGAEGERHRVLGRSAGSFVPDCDDGYPLLSRVGPDHGPKTK